LVNDSSGGGTRWVVEDEQKGGQGCSLSDRWGAGHIGLHDGTGWSQLMPGGPRMTRNLVMESLSVRD